MNGQNKNEFNRNYWAMTLEGACFLGGVAMLSTGGAVALFINVMTGSKALVGLAVTFQSLFMIIGQLTSAPYVRSIRKLPDFLFNCMIPQRMIPIFMAIPLLLGASANLSVGIFLVLFAIFWFSDGFTTVPWGELCVRALKPELRGHMMGVQTTIGGIVALLAGLLLTWLLATPILDDYHRFAMIFILASVILLSSLIPFRFARDPNPIANPEKLNVRQYYARIPSIIRHSKPLQHALIARMPSFVGFAAVPFIVVFGESALDISEAQVSWLVYANIVGGLIGGILIGEASKRLGNRPVILLCNSGLLVSMIMAVLLAFFPILGYLWLFVTCVLASLTLSIWIGFFNYFLDIAPDTDRSVFQVIGTFIGIPFSFVGYALGSVIDKWGYAAAFSIGGIFTAAALLLSIRLLSRERIGELSH